MKGLLALITEKAPAIVKSTTHILENDKARAFIKTTSPHPDVEIIHAIAFKKKPHFKDLAPAMTAAKKMGETVVNIAKAAGCSTSTVYKVIRDATKK